VYLPVFLDGDLPAPLGPGGPAPDGRNLWWRVYRLGRRLHRQPEAWGVLRENLGRLQVVLDQEAREFAADGAVLRERRAAAELQRLATLYMQHTLEQFEKVLAGHEESADRAASWERKNRSMAASHP